MPGTTCLSAGRATTCCRAAPGSTVRSDEVQHTVRDDRLLWDDPVNIDSFDGGAGYDRMTIGAVAAALDTVTGVEEAVFSGGSSSLFVDATLMGDLERVTANSGGTVQLLTLDSWSAGTSIGGYTLWTAGFNGEQLWIDDDALVDFV